MSNEPRLQAFDPRDEHPIPPWPGPGPAPTKPERVYVIGMRTIEGCIEFYFVERPPLPDPSGDGPLEIRVPEDCVIVLRLDPAWKWGFRTDNAVMFGPMAYPEVPRYFNLQGSEGAGRCQEVRFNAHRLNIKEENRDPYALYIEVDQRVREGTAIVPLLIRIDPDVTNPGDPPPPPPDP